MKLSSPAVTLPSYTETDGSVTTNNIAATTWTDFTCTGAASCLVHILVYNGQGGVQTLGVRTNGSSLTRTNLVGNSCCIIFPVLCDSSGVVKIYASAQSVNIVWKYIGKYS